MKSGGRPFRKVGSFLGFLILPWAVLSASDQTGGFVLVPEKTQLPVWSGNLPVSGGFSKGTAAISASNGRLTIDRSITYNGLYAKNGTETIHIEWQVDPPPAFLPLGQNLRIACRGSATPPGSWNDDSDSFWVRANIYVQTPGWQPVQRELINGVWAGDPADMEAGMGLIYGYRRSSKMKFIGSGSMYSEGTLDPAFAYQPGQELRVSFYFEDQPGSYIKWPDDVYRACPMHGNPLAVYFYRYDARGAGGGGGTDAGSAKPPADPKAKPPVKGTPCDRFDEALAKVRCLEWHLQTLRQMRTEMESSRIAMLGTMYGSDAIDIAFMGASVWTNTVGRWMGSRAVLQAAKQTALAKVLQAVIKAALKDSMKTFLDDAKNQNISIAQLLSTGADAGGRKFLSETMKNSLAAEGTARMMGLGATAASTGGQLPPALLKMVQSEYVNPSIDAAFVAIDMLKLLNAVPGQIDMCNAMRDGIKRFDQNVLSPRELQLDLAKQDLDVAKAACDQWRKDNPERGIRR
jgi:hypothetical protein